MKTGHVLGMWLCLWTTRPSQLSLVKPHSASYRWVYIRKRGWLGVGRVANSCRRWGRRRGTPTDALSKSGLDSLDYRRDLIVQNRFREIKDPKQFLHYLLQPIKVPQSQMVLRPTCQYQLLAKLLAIYETLYHFAFSRSLTFLVINFHVHVCLLE